MGAIYISPEKHRDVLVFIYTRRESKYTRAVYL